MGQMVSGLDAVYTRRRRSWQDTSPLTNQLVNHLGPGRTAQSLQFNLDISGQSYHRDSMKGQVKDIPNPQALYALPVQVVLQSPPDMTAGEAVRRDSMKGQTPNIQNFILDTGIFNPPAQPRAIMVNPVFNKHPTQETTIQRNPVIDLPASTLPFNTNIFDTEQIYHRDTLSGQYGTNNPIVALGVPPAFNEIYTAVFKRKPAQEPFVYPNRVIIGIPAIQPPTILLQSEIVYRAHPAQDPFIYPNVLAITQQVTEPFVHQQFEDHQWRRPKTQETFTFPNVLLVAPLPQFPATMIYGAETLKAKPAQEPFVYPNILIENLPPGFQFPFVQELYEHLQWRGHKTQEHYDFLNVTIYTLPPIIPVPPTPGSGTGRYGGRVILQAKKLGETVFQNADFISQLNSNETIVSAACRCVVYTGQDPNPSAVLDGIPAISGTTISQLTTAGVVGTIYELLFAATTSLGQVIELTGYLAVVPDLP